MRWRTKLQRLQQMAKAVNLSVLQLEHFTQDVFLQLCVVDSDGSAADLHAVQHEVVVLSSNLTSDIQKLAERSPMFRANTYEVLLSAPEILQVLVHRRRERMMAAAPAALGHQVLVFIRMREQREFGDPQEVRVLW